MFLLRNDQNNWDGFSRNDLDKQFLIDLCWTQMKLQEKLVFTFRYRQANQLGSVLIRENTGQWKPVLSHNLCCAM